MKKRLPKFKTDEEAIEFMKQDLSDYINLENFTRVTFEFVPKDKSITLRISSELLKSVQNVAKKRGVNYQKLIREAIEAFLKKAA
jgi:predicted DNA binding CopG/RHH family protein